MNFPWRGGLLFALLFTQDPAPARPDLAAQYAAILENGPESRRDLAARALLSLGKPGYEALKRVLAAKPEFAKSVAAPGDQPPPTALVRIAPADEPRLWEALDSPDPAAVLRAARALRDLYAAPDSATPGRPSQALSAELNRRRDFDLTGRSLIEFLKEEPVSWILMSPRDERITLKLKGVTLRDFFRIATPKLAAVAWGDLLLLVPPDRIAAADPPGAVWAPSELAPRIELALDALARGDDGPINALTGAGAYHALKRAARSPGDPFSTKADEMRRQLEQRIFFVGAPDEDQGKSLEVSTAGTTAKETIAAFEKAAGVAIEVTNKSRLDGSPPAFRFRGIPARLAARALTFRVNLIY
ncbi:MAG TPA: hypothetical protein VFC86_04125 [Planctomycetota bacterium]|nr:hypothetical protein [Planctomycetota bacterium]